MPAGAPGAIGPVEPGLWRLVRLGSLPEHEVQRIVLSITHRHAFSGAQLVQRLARELAVAGELAHRVIHVAALGPVGQALAFERTDEREHLRHVFGRARLDIRRLNAELGDVSVHRCDHLVGQRADRDTAIQCTADDLVVDVGDVAHILDFVAAGAQPALHHVKRHHHAGMADVAQVVDGHAADVHAHMARFDRGKLFQGTRERVVDAQTHGDGGTKQAGRRGAKHRAGDADPAGHMHASTAPGVTQRPLWRRCAALWQRTVMTTLSATIRRSISACPASR